MYFFVVVSPSRDVCNTQCDRPGDESSVLYSFLFLYLRQDDDDDVLTTKQYVYIHTIILKIPSLSLQYLPSPLLSLNRIGRGCRNWCVTVVIYEIISIDFEEM